MTQDEHCENAPLAGRGVEEFVEEETCQDQQAQIMPVNIGAEEYAGQNHLRET